MSRTLANTFLKKRVCIILLHPAFLCNHWSSSLQTRGVARQWAFWAWAYCDIRHWCLCSTARQNLNDKANVKHSNLTNSLVFYFLNNFPYHAHSYSPLWERLCCRLYLALPLLESYFSGNSPPAPSAAPTTSPSPSLTVETGWGPLSLLGHL